MINIKLGSIKKGGYSLSFLFTIFVLFQMFFTLGSIAFIVNEFQESHTETAGLQMNRIRSRQIDRFVSEYIWSPGQVLIQINSELDRGHFHWDHLDDIAMMQYSMLDQYPLVSGFIFGSRTGEVRASYRTETGEKGYASQPFSHPEDLVFYLGKRNDTRSKVLSRIENYNVTNRPWYQSARRLGKPGWSKIYQWVILGFIGMDMVIPVYDSNQNILGVFSTSLSFMRIQHFLESNQSGVSIILTADNRLIASSLKEDRDFIQGSFSRSGSLPFLRDHPLQYISDFATSNLSQDGKQEKTGSFSGPGGMVYFQVSNTHGTSLDRPWKIVTFISSKEIVSSSYGGLRTSLLFYISFIVIIILFIFLGTFALLRPIQNLKKAAIRLTAGDWDAKVEPGGAREFNQVGDAFNRMADKLKDAFGRIEERNQDLKTSNDRLTEINQLLEAMIESSPDIIVIKDINGRIVRVNQTFRKYMNVSDEEILGKTSRELFSKTGLTVDPSTGGFFEPEVSDSIVMEKNEPLYIDYRFLKGDKVLYFEVTKQVVLSDSGEVYGILVVMRDMTERKLNERKIQETEQRINMIARITGVGVWEYSIPQKTFWLSPMHEQLFGSEYKSKSLSLDEFQKGLHPEDLIQKHLDEIETGTTRDFEFRFRFKKPDSGYNWILSRGHVLEVTSEGKPLTLIGFHLDVTGMIRTEEERARFAFILENVDEGILLLGEALNVIFANQAMGDMCGFSIDEMKKMDPLKIIPGVTAEQIDGFRKEIGQTGIWQGKFESRRKDGSLYELEAIITGIRTTTGEPGRYVMICHETTREAELERQLRRKQRLETVGTLAGGIAHDFNNILGSILLNTDLAIDDVENGEADQIKDSLIQIKNASFRARDLIRQILTFTRQVDQKVQAICIGEVALEAIEFLKASLVPSIEIVHTLSVQDGPVMADPARIHQLVMNLCVNAAQAMKETGGVLELECSTKTIGPGEAGDLVPGQYVSFVVSDTGHGISQNNLQRIFDPFFTTREAGEGTGLGLSVVHGIVTSHNGRISVESESGRGSSFEVLLPLNQETLERMPPVVIDDSGESRHVRILFVDDEETLGEAIQSFCRTRGIEIDRYIDPIQALEGFQKAPGSYNLVITDFLMPGMQGDRFAEKIKALKPGIPVLLITGRLDFNPVDQNHLFDLILPKPFTTAELMGAIQRLTN